MKPFHLGECDWLLYRRRFNHFHPKTRNFAAYERGYASCRSDIPKPAWKALP